MKVQLGPVAANGAFDVVAILCTEDSLAKDDVVNAFDKALGGALRALIKQEEWTAKKDSQLAFSPAGKIPAKRVYLLGVAKDDTVALRNACARAAKNANADKAKSLALVLSGAPSDASVRAASEGVALGAYRFAKYLTGDRKPKSNIATVTVAVREAKAAGKGAKPASFAGALSKGVAVGSAVNLVRDLVNEPPNELYPETFAARAKALCDAHKIKCVVWDHKKIQAEGMKLLHAVGRGSRHEPRFVHMTYTPKGPAKKGRKKLVVVGKGLTFDSGGLCIKQAAGMGDMKCDMAGAALSVGLMAAISALEPDLEVHSIFAAAENMPDGNAYRPGDIWGSLDGKSVEIINTDAEGRLVLADALTYAAKLEPDVLIDHATLTGACMIALGAATAGMYSNDDALAAKYVKSAKEAGESLWHMPLIEDLRDSMKSDCADLKHTGDRYGGSIIGGLFLREFIGKCKHWIHMDIAGPAFAERPTSLGPKGGTGFGLLTLLRFVETMANEK
jgi:leucyl aminopeptidase